MELSRLLERRKPAILKKWLGEIFATYPADTARFLRDEHDMFANPVGHTIAVGAGRLLDGLMKQADTAALSADLEQIIRIRAVQDFTPSGAVSFIASLKTVVTDQLQTEIHKHNLQEEWAELETRIDSLTECAYALHAQMKENIDIIRSKETDRGERLLKRLMECRTG